ncbi:MAG TPA: HlyD family efflux transporter periplasmic adaptor subunit [Myxococcota bacterium]
MTDRAATPAVAALLLCLAGCSGGESSVAVGTLERDRLDLVAESSEPVLARPVEEGAFVEAGALVIALDPTRLGAQVAEAEGARGRAAARLAELVRGPRSERIAEARARLEGAEGRLATARSDIARAKELVAQGVVTQEQLDQQRASFDEALAARDAARASLDELLTGTTAEELDQAQAAVAEADAALAEARVRLARLEVTAPSAGWVDALPYHVGERPPAGGVVAVLLVDQAPYARVYVPAALRARVVPGVSAAVRVDGVDADLRGRVRSVAREASFTPYFALTERDRGRLVYLAKVDLLDAQARGLPTGVPVEVTFEFEAGPEPAP